MLLSSAACIALGISWVAAADPVIQLGYTTLRGNASLPGVHFFGGIPYVRPPVGDLRFRAPVRLDERSKANPPVVDSRGWGPICIQQPAVVGFGYEDCLSLNVWKPPNADEKSKLPVVLYIHGGGHYYNSAQGFPMNDWIPASNGTIVAVSLQYRLGLLGFLASSSPQFQSKAEGGVYNLGLLDQREALEWIQRHISKFGGDPTKVTIAGESGGAADVLFHMNAYGGKQTLFRGAIAQSIGTDPTPNATEYEACYQGVLASTGCSSLSCLRTASLSTIVAAVNNRGSCKFGPVVDGGIIPDLPSKLITNATTFAEATKRVTFMGGSCTDDGSIFVGNSVGFAETDAGFVAAIKKRYTKLSDASVQKMLALYPLSDFSSQWQRAKVAFGDTVFTCQDYTVTKAYVDAKKGGSAFNYRFNTPDPVLLAAAPYKGVMHTSDLYFLFDGTNSGPSSQNAVGIFHPFNATEAPLAREALSAWIAFTRDLNPSAAPTSSAMSAWGPASLNGTRWVFQEGSSANGTASFLENVSEAHKARCAFWAGLSSEIGV